MFKRTDEVNNKKNREVKQRFQNGNGDTKSIVILLAAVAAFLCICIFATYEDRKDNFVYEDCLDEEVLTVDDRVVTLREFGYYIYEVERFVNEQATIYDASNPLAYWNVHFKTGMGGIFISRMARNKAYSVCICDIIYEEMALAQGYELGEEERKEALEAADNIYHQMTELQLTKTGLTKELIEEICCRKKLVAVFAKDFVRAVDFTGYTGYREELLSADGAYYEDNILPAHKVTLNRGIRRGLKFGRITVNTKKETARE